MENITVENANELLAKAKISDTNYRQQAAAWVIINQFCYQSGLYHKRDEDHLSGIQKVIKYLSETQSKNKALQRELDNEIKIREEYFEDAQILLDDKKKLESDNKRLSAILSISDDLANGRDEVIVSSGLRIIKLESENKALREENTKCKELSWEAANEISRLKKEIERLKAEVLKEKFPEN